MSSPNFDSRYITPSQVDGKIAAQAVTDAGQYATKSNPIFTGVVSVPSPVNASDAVTKQYVDRFASTLADASTQSNQVLGGNTFTKVALPNEDSDIGNNYDQTTSLYTVPVSGTYLTIARLRIADNTAGGSNIGIGVHHTAMDGPYFQWQGVQSVMRQTFNYQRIAYWNAGVQLQLYTFASTGMTIVQAAMTNIRIA